MQNLYIGAMSGTSVDGLDLCLLQDGSPPRILHGETVPFPVELRRDLLALIHDEAGAGIDLLGHCDVALGRFIGHVLLTFLADRGLAAEDITAIGSHGQTVRHRPSGENAFTMQIGDGHQIAEITGITTVTDFRRRDIAAGGQGAPLVPAFHQALFSSPAEARVILNIGGIANVTRLAAGERLTGFDTGPGNALSDAWIAEHLEQRMDRQGAWAESGRVSAQLLGALLDDEYLQREAPKSTGREHYNLAWLHRRLDRLTAPVAAADVQATLIEFTATTIADALRRSYTHTDRVIACGGGRHNTYLMGRLRHLVAVPVDPSETWGIDGDSLEAAAFAWFASQALRQIPASPTSVTGARSARILGLIHR